MRTEPGGTGRGPRRSERSVRARLAGWGLCAVLLGGCAGSPVARPAAPGTGDAARVERADGLMLDDLVAALVQLHPPRTTTVQVTLDGDSLEEALAERLALAGYGIQRVDADQGAHRVALARRRALSAAGVEHVSLELAVGVTTLARDYARAGGTLRPAGALVVGGTRAGVVLDDSRFGDAAEAQFTAVVRGAAPERIDGAPLISLIGDEVVGGVVRDTTRPGAPSVAAVNSGSLEVTNRFYGDGGAFGSLRDGLESVERTVVIFPNDSMRLGTRGKRRIERLVERYREGSDMIGLVGCSNGPTALAIGNEGLALGRSRRVADELVALGVARERVLDEGCWSGEGASERFPSRGVVLELLRRGA